MRVNAIVWEQEEGVGARGANGSMGRVWEEGVDMGTRQRVWEQVERVGERAENGNMGRVWGREESVGEMP